MTITLTNAEFSTVLDALHRADKRDETIAKKLKSEGHDNAARVISDLGYDAFALRLRLIKENNVPDNT